MKGPLLPPPPPLLAVALVFQSRKISDVLILDKATSFLHSAVEMALCDACKFDSVALLDRIWNSSTPESEPADAGSGNGGRWSRRKYLRTDPHSNRFQFRCSRLEAVRHKGVEVVQRLFEHLYECVVPFGAVHTLRVMGSRICCGTFWSMAFMAEMELWLATPTVFAERCMAANRGLLDMMKTLYGVLKMRPWMDIHEPDEDLPSADIFAWLAEHEEGTRNQTRALLGWKKTAMGNALLSKGFVYSSNDYQLAIETSKELEYLLEKEFGAVGGGLHEKVSSVESALPVPTIRSIRYVATLRNQLIHNREMRALPDRQMFIKKFDDAMSELQILIDKKRLDAGGAETASPGCVIS